jgi:hypothetical protein
MDELVEAGVESKRIDIEVNALSKMDDDAGTGSVPRRSLRMF